MKKIFLATVALALVGAAAPALMGVNYRFNWGVGRY